MDYQVDIAGLMSAGRSVLAIAQQARGADLEPALAAGARGIPGADAAPALPLLGAQLDGLVDRWASAVGLLALGIGSSSQSYEQAEHSAVGEFTGASVDAGVSR